MKAALIMTQKNSLLCCFCLCLRTRPAFVIPLLAAILRALAIAGGASHDEQVRIPDDRFGLYVPLTLPIILVGDTQEHESTGFPLYQSDGAVDSYVEVAQRPPEQPLFGRRLLEWAIESHPDEPMVHLGDVIDLSCQSEHRRMQKIFEKAKNYEFNNDYKVIQAPPKVEIIEKVKPYIVNVNKYIERIV